MKTISKNPGSVQRAREAAASAARDAVRASRRDAFVAEADPMVGQVLRGEITLDTYVKTVEAIRARHPYPEETA